MKKASLGSVQLINNFLLPQYSCVNIFVKGRINRTVVCPFERVWLHVCCVHVSTSHVLYTQTKIPSKYSNKRNPLMSNTVHLENVQFGLFLTHNKLLLFKNSCVNISRKRRISWTIVCAFERALLFVVCKCRLLKSCTRRENPLWISKQ